MPKRIQRKRTKGSKMPPNTVYVGRPTRWGNPYNISPYNDAAACVILYRENWERHIRGKPAALTQLRDKLQGEDLACWCPLCHQHSAGKPFGVQCDECAPCHADVLLEIVNR